MARDRGCFSTETRRHGAQRGASERRGPWAWPCGCVLLVLLLVGARPAQAYQWELDAPDDAVVLGLGVKDVHLSNGGQGLGISWRYQPLGASTPIFEVQRVNGGTTVSLGQTTAHTVVDSGFAFGTAYDYRVRVYFDESAPSMALPAPPACADPSAVFNRSYASGTPWMTLHVTPERIVAGANQAVDSRLDLRYATPVFQDVHFGSRVYRGGLWAGYKGDPARVGRSFLRFTLPAVPSGDLFLTGSVSAYATRASDFGSTQVGLQAVDPSWSATTLNWTNAPALSPTAATQLATVHYLQDLAGNPYVSVDQYNGDTGTNWTTWLFEAPMYGALFGGGGVLSAGLASTNESAGGWVYFAKKEYDAAKAPAALYAHGYPANILRLSLDHYAVTDGDPITGTVTLTAYPPAAGLRVHFTFYSWPDLAAESIDVTMAAGSKSLPFSIPTLAISEPEAVTLIVSLDNGDQDLTDLWVSPY